MTYSTSLSIEELDRLNDWISLPVNVRGFISESDRDAAFNIIRKKYENRRCFDCDAMNPTWTSIHLGLFICLNCAGHYRRAGTHISLVRSTEMDNFTREQLIYLDLGGNAKARSFFKTRSSSGSNAIDLSSNFVLQYKKQLQSTVEDCLKNVGMSIAKLTSETSANGTSTSRDSINITNINQQQQLSPIIKPSTVESTADPLPPIKNDGYTKHVNTSNMMNVMKTSNDVTTTKNAVKAKRLDVDFDFESAKTAVAATQLTSTPNVAPVTRLANADDTQQNHSPYAVSSSSSQPEAAASSIYNKFSNAKSISSDQFFSREVPRTKEYEAMIAQKFSNSSSISSRDLFGAQNQNEEREEKLAAYIRDLKDTAGNGIASLATAGAEMWESAKDWLYRH